MRWLSSFALLLYLTILCTPQAFAVHDQRLSPLADTQFHAVTPHTPCFSFYADADSNDEPQPALPLPAFIHQAPTRSILLCASLLTDIASFLTAVQARAPPHLSLS